MLAAACSGDDDGAATTSPADTAALDATGVVEGTAAAADRPVSVPAGDETVAPSTQPAATATPVALTPTGEQCGLLALDTAGDDTLGALVASTPELSTLAALVDAAGLASLLADPGPTTLLAPTNAAFDALDPQTRDAIEADPSGVLARVLGLHVLDGAYPVGVLVAGGPVAGAAGTVTAISTDGRTVVDAGGGSATIGCQDVPTTNGVLHLVDRVLMPPPVDTESVGGSQLALVDPATGAATASGAFGEELGVLDVVAIDDATLVALTDGAELVTFSPASPATPTARVAITGVEGATLLALDRTPDGALVGITDLSGVYRIDLGTGVGTPVGPGLDPGVDDLGVAADVGADGLLRLVVATGLDVGVDPATGAVVASGPPPAFGPDDPHAGVPARLLAIASTSGGLVGIEGTTASLVRLGEEGRLTTIGPLGVGLTDGAGLDATPDGTLYLTVPG